MNRKQKTLPKFYAIYLIVLLIAVIVMCFVLSFVRNLLSEYEGVQPKYEAQQVYQTYFERFSYPSLTNYYNVSDFLADSGYKTEEEMFTALDKLLEGKDITYFQSSQSKDTIEYTVTADKYKIATFTLIPAEEKTKHDFPVYRLGTVTVYNLIRAELITSGETQEPTVYYTVLIDAPASASVFVDGQPIDEEMLTGVSNVSGGYAHLKSGVDGIPYRHYKLLVEEIPASVTATDLNGDTLTADYDESRSTFTVPLTFSKALDSQFSDYAIDICKKLSIYMQAQAAFSTVSGFYDPNTPIYTQIQKAAADAWMVKKFDSCDFSDIKTSEFYAYSDTDVSLRVVMLQIGHKSGKPDSTDLLDYTLCLHLVDGKWLIYESYNN